MSETPKAPETVRAEAPAPEPRAAAPAAESLQYSEIVMAPDACYRILPDARRIEREETLAVQRNLVRDDGFCAQAITPVEVSGVIEDTGGFAKVIVEIVNVAGEVTQTFVIKP